MSKTPILKLVPPPLSLQPQNPRRWAFPYCNIPADQRRALVRRARRVANGETVQPYKRKSLRNAKSFLNGQGDYVLFRKAKKNRIGSVWIAAWEIATVHSTGMTLRGYDADGKYIGGRIVDRVDEAELDFIYQQPRYDK